MRSVRIAAVVLVVAAFVGATGPLVHADPQPQNVVLILTDDQVAGTMQYMPNVMSLLVDKGAEFTNVYDNNPWCCPARTTIMTGQTSGHNGVWAVPNSAIGGFKAFKANVKTTVFQWMHDAGYRTAMIGKFLNGYKAKDVPWVLPGVDEWDAFLLDGVGQNPPCNPHGYIATCYSHSSNGAKGTWEYHGPSDLSATTSGDKAVGFIDSTPASQPLFLYYAPRAPHLPTLPESKYMSSCQGLPSERQNPGFNESIINGPAFEQRAPFNSKTLQWFDDKWLADCQALLSTDDQVAKIVNALRDSGRLSNTLIMYTSDNGFEFGQHRWKGKIAPWQLSDQIPFVIRYDALGSQPSTDAHLVTDMDYTATFADVAGVSPPSGYQMDGQSWCR